MDLPNTSIVYFTVMSTALLILISIWVGTWHCLFLFFSFRLLLNSIDCMELQKSVYITNSLSFLFLIRFKILFQLYIEFSLGKASLLAITVVTNSTFYPLFLDLSIKVSLLFVHFSIRFFSMLVHFCEMFCCSIRQMLDQCVFGTLSSSLYLHSRLLKLTPTSLICGHN